MSRPRTRGEAARRLRSWSLFRKRTAIPILAEDDIPVRPVKRAVVALALGVALGMLAGLFIPRRKGE